MKRVAIALLSCAISGMAVADGVEQPYIGLDYQLGSFSENGSGSKSLGAVAARLGSELAPNFAVEAHAVYGVRTAKVTVDNSDYNVELHGIYGAFVRPQVKLGDNARVFVLGGYSFAEYKAKATSTGNDSVFGSENGFSYGAGIDLGASEGWRIGGEFVHYLHSYQALSVGVVKIFD